MSENAPPATPPATPPPAPGKTAAEIAAEGKTAADLKDLQTKYSALEDRNKSLGDELKTLQKSFADLGKAPSAKKQGRSLLDDVNEFLGFSESDSPIADGPGAKA